MGWFSSDRTIREYAEDIWHVPVASQMPTTFAQLVRKAT
jgi:starch phosphorylase